MQGVPTRYPRLERDHVDDLHLVSRQHLYWWLFDRGWLKDSAAQQIPAYEDLGKIGGSLWENVKRHINIPKDINAPPLKRIGEAYQTFGPWT